jgi:hypothetical protein
MVAAASLLGLGAVSAAPARAADGVSFSATLNDRPVDRIDSNNPLTMRPQDELRVSVAIRNDTSAPVEVRSVKVDGRVLNMSFFLYNTRIDRTIEPGETGRANVGIDISDLSEQATGLLPARIQLLDRDRNVLAEHIFPVDVRGSLTSTYGLFGILVAIITLLLLATALIRLAMRQLPENRWFRATRFAVPGIGIGMTLTFTLSALRVLVPGGSSWLAFIVVGGLVGLAVGFFTPGPAPEPSRYTPDEPALVGAGQSHPIDLRDGNPAGYPADPDVMRSPVDPDAGSRSRAQY